MNVGVDANAAADGLNKAVESLEVNLGIELTNQHLWSDLPNPEKIILVHYVLATVCRQLEDDDSITASDKADILMSKLEIALNPITARSPGAVRPILLPAEETDCQTICSAEDMDAIQIGARGLFACVDETDHRFGFLWGRQCTWVKDRSDKRSKDFLCPCLPRNLSLTEY